MIRPRATIRCALSALLLMIPEAVVAQDAGGPTRLDGTRLAPRALHYTASLQSGPMFRRVGDRTVRVERSTYTGFATWTIRESFGTGATAGADSIILEFATLRPMHWGGYAQGGLSRLSVEFRSDSLFGGITAPQGRRSLGGAVPRGALLSAAMTETLLPLYPLGPGWRDSITAVAMEVGTTEYARGEAAVLAEERVVTPAGTFECWLVSYATPGGEVSYWIDRTQRIVVRSARLLRDRGEVLVYELARIER